MIFKASTERNLACGWRVFLAMSHFDEYSDYEDSLAPLPLMKLRRRWLTHHGLRTISANVRTTKGLSVSVLGLLWKQSEPEILPGNVLEIPRAFGRTLTIG